MSNNKFYYTNSIASNLSQRAVRNYYNTSQTDLENGKKLLKSEEILIKNNNPCPPKQLDILTANIQHLDAANTEELLFNDFFNPNVMREVQCIANSIYYTAPLGQGLTVEERLRQHLYREQAIGEESANSRAYLAYYENSPLHFVLKEPREENSNLPLFHEAVVGLYAINDLRKYCYNFMYTYGLFNSTDAVVTPNKKVISFLPEGKKYNHLLVESIDKAVSFQDFLDTCTVQQFIDTFMQVMYALEFANQKCEFTHYDLHTGNVLVAEKFPQTRELVYVRRNGKRYINCTSLAQIIDFGDTHVKIKGKDYGVYNKTFAGVYNKANAIYDVYKFLGFIGYKLFVTGCNNPQLDALKYYVTKAIRIFNPDDNVVSIFADQRELFYVYLKETAFNDISEYIDILEDAWRLDYTKSSGFPIVGCNNDSCLSLAQILQTSGIYPYSVAPTDIFSLSDVYNLLRKEKKSQEANKYLQTYASDPRILDSFKASMQYITENMEKLKGDITNIKIVAFDKIMLLQSDSYVTQVMIYYLQTLNDILFARYTNKVAKFYASYIKSKEDIGIVNSNSRLTTIVYENLRSKVRPFLLAAIKEIDRHRDLYFSRNSWLAQNYDVARANITA
jgi:hypothetical protein